MEPVSTALIAAGAAAGAQDTVSRSIGDLYAGLKALVLRKCGATQALPEALEHLEQKPTSTGWREEVQTALAQTGAATDPEVIAAAERLLADLRSSEDGRAHVQTIIGRYNAQAGPGATATVRVTGRD